MKEINCELVTNDIIDFLKNQAKKANKVGYVIGVSGGIDSAVTSTIAAKTGLKLYVIQMPIKQSSSEVNRAAEHINWLLTNFKNVYSIDCNLTNTFESFLKNVDDYSPNKELQGLTEANTRSRLRMITLYYFSSLKNCLVLGTGNKVEDFGIGFFTKYGDGGVDVSPIGDLMKSEVRKIGEFLNISKDIIKAKPTDGLWGDGRCDEDQIGATYDELEWAMEFKETIDFENKNEFIKLILNLSDRQKQVLKIFNDRQMTNKHKVEPIPVCYIKNKYDIEDSKI